MGYSIKTEVFTSQRPLSHIHTDARSNDATNKSELNLEECSVGIDGAVESNLKYKKLITRQGYKLAGIFLT